MLHRTLNHQYHIAIVGCGQRGLYALQSLISQFQTTAKNLSEAEKLDLGVHVSIIDMNDFPGAGSMCDPFQPKYLLLNVTADKVDAWRHIDPSNRPEDRLNLTSWLAKNGYHQYSGHSYVPRAVFGQYLHDCFDLTISDLPARVTVEVFRDKVISLSLENNAIDLTTQNGHQLSVDEVLLTMTHPEPTSANFAEMDTAKAKLISPSFTSLQDFSTRKDLTRKYIALRGFELPFVDMALALTEGRGGQFVSAAEGNLSYKPSGKEPSKLYPFSQISKHMLASTSPNAISIDSKMERIWEQGISELLFLAGRRKSLNFKASLEPVILDTAERIYSHARPNSVNSLNLWMGERVSKRTSTIFVVDGMETSIRVASGETPITFEWALGETWRRLYQILNHCVSQSELSESSRSEFRRFALEMDRLAFGPSTLNLRKIVALIEAGIVDLEYLSGELSAADPDQMSLKTLGHQQSIDWVIDVTMPNTPDSILSQISTESSNGVVTEAYGIHIHSDGSLEDGGGGFGGRLSELGKPAGDYVFGLDSQRQRLDSQSHSWAVSALKRAQWINQNQSEAQA